MPDIKIVFSDLHLGAGLPDAGNWLEDFDQDDLFAALLGRLAAESEATQQGMELVLAGDTFEFLQVPAIPPEDYSSERSEERRVG